MKKYFSVSVLLLLGSTPIMASCPKTFTLEQARQIIDGGLVIDGKKFVPLDGSFKSNLPKSPVSKWQFSPQFLSESTDHQTGIVTCRYSYQILGWGKYDLIIKTREFSSAEKEALASFKLDPKTVTWDQIRKTYLNLSKEFHPDRKGGTKEDFEKIGSAYEVLKTKFGK